MIPIRNQILCKPFPSDSVTVGGIIVPDSCKEVSSKVKIIAVGNGTKDKPMRLKKGETAYRVKGHGVEILIDDELHFLMEDNAILAIE